jgi:hypothetical protein
VCALVLSFQLRRFACACTHPHKALPNERLHPANSNKVHLLTDLSHLVRLDVLDVHSNAITSLEPISQLSTLRIMNASSNAIQRLPDLLQLTRLLELNLHRNKITTISCCSCSNGSQSADSTAPNFLSSSLAKASVWTLGSTMPGVKGGDGVHCAPFAGTSPKKCGPPTNELLIRFPLPRALQRLYIGHNNISLVRDILGIATLPHLVELTVASNPVCTCSHPTVRFCCLCPTGALTRLLQLCFTLHGLENALCMKSKITSTGFDWLTRTVQCQRHPVCSATWS